MLGDEESEARQELIELHQKMVEQYEVLRCINCADENFAQLIISIQLLIEQSAELVAEVAAAFYPVQAAAPRPRCD